MYDVVIIGGGPAGLSAALAFGRARRKVLLLDAGEPRNAKAREVHNFHTRDGTPPREMRRLAHEELARYPSVERRIEWVKRLEPHADRVTVHIGCDSVDARRVLLATGMIDVLPDLPGYRELWGEAIFQCPYCHGWEVQDLPWGVFAANEHMFEFALVLRAWTSDLVVFTNGLVPSPEARAKLVAAGIGIEERTITGVRAGEPDAHGATLAAVLVEGGEVPRRVIFARPPQQQSALVRDLGLELDEMGFVKIDAMYAQTSVPRIHAAGDLTTMAQGAVVSAAAGTMAAARMNHSLMTE